MGFGEVAIIPQQSFLVYGADVGYGSTERSAAAANNEMDRSPAHLERIVAGIF